MHGAVARPGLVGAGALENQQLDVLVAARTHAVLQRRDAASNARDVRHGSAALMTTSAMFTVVAWYAPGTQRRAAYSTKRHGRFWALRFAGARTRGLVTRHERPREAVWK